MGVYGGMSSPLLPGQPPVNPYNDKVLVSYVGESSEDLVDRWIEVDLL